MKVFTQYRFTEQVRSRIRRHAIWALDHPRPDWAWMRAGLPR